MISFFPYMGGKQRLVRRLLRLIPSHRIYVEPFGGAASLLLNKAPTQIEVFNDVDGELVNLFLVVRDHPAEFIRHVASLPYSRELYERLQLAIKRGRLKGNKVERAARFYYLIRASFFGHVEKGWRFALKTAEANRLYNSIGEIETIARRLQSVYIDRLDFRRCLKNWDREDAFFFLDPPYLDSTPYRRGLRPFTLKDHQELASLTCALRGKWLLTLNDHPRVHELYRGYQVTKVDTQMATAKVTAGAKRPRLRQLIIRNLQSEVIQMSAENPAAPPAPGQTGAAAVVGNPRDIQGILALSVVGGTFAVAAVAIATGVANAVQVLASVLPLAGTIVGFYFGQKSQTG